VTVMYHQQVSSEVIFLLLKGGGNRGDLGKAVAKAYLKGGFAIFLLGKKKA